MNACDDASLHIVLYTHYLVVDTLCRPACGHAGD